MDFTLGGPAFCFLLGGVFLFIGICLPVARRAMGLPPGLSHAPTVVEFFGKGMGFHGERIDVSHGARAGQPPKAVAAVRYR